jgi:hypothetical protein
MFETYMDIIFDVLFFIDALLTFFVAIITEDYKIIDNKKDIAIIYIKGWFFVDILSCIPIGALGKALLSAKAAQSITLIKLIKLLRLTKIIKEKQKIFKYMEIYLKIDHIAF